jgi:hypothetical protein
MRVVSKRWLRALLLTSVYLLGALGILASGGGGSGGDDVEATGIYLDQPDSPTLDSSITVTGRILVTRDPNSEYSVQVNFKWRNKLTGESGTSGVVFSRKCTILPPHFSYPIVIPKATEVFQFR